MQPGGLVLTEEAALGGRRGGEGGPDPLPVADVAVDGRDGPDDRRGDPQREGQPGDRRVGGALREVLDARDDRPRREGGGCGVPVIVCAGCRGARDAGGRADPPPLRCPLCEAGYALGTSRAKPDFGALKKVLGEKRKGDADAAGEAAGGEKKRKKAKKAAGAGSGAGAPDAGAPDAGAPDAGARRLIVGKLPFLVSATALRGAFLARHAGNAVEAVQWLADRATGQFYGSAFVRVATTAAARRLVADAVVLEGQRLKIRLAPVRDGAVWPPPGSERHCGERPPLS